jgi:hypothetical protein|eukprot:COSAG02_NODE_189_length_30109_cov_71.135855_12_plen_529_part_00
MADAAAAERSAKQREAAATEEAKNAKKEAKREAALAEEERQREIQAQLRQLAEEEAAAAAAETAAKAEALRQKTLDAQPFNLSIAKRKRLGGEQRPCIGIASQIVVRSRPQDGKEYDDPSGCRLVPFDVSAVAEYLGFPLDQWPGLAAVAKLALLEKLPEGDTTVRLSGDGELGVVLDKSSAPPCKISAVKAGSLAEQAGLQPGWPVVAVNGRGVESKEHPEVSAALEGVGVVRPLTVTVRRGGWKEVDPQSQAKLPGWQSDADGAAVAASGAFGSKLVYWHQHTGKVLLQHPRDAFYRYLLKVLLEKNECPFEPSIMQFNVTDSVEIESSFFFEFATNKTMVLVDVLAEADASTLTTKDGVVKANNVINDAWTQALVEQLTPEVQRAAGQVIWRGYAYWRSRQKWVFLAPLTRIRRNILIRRLQLAVRRRWLRLDLRAWEDRRLRKHYYRIWWQQAIKSETFAHSLHKVLATKYVAKTAAKARSPVEIGDLRLDKEGQRLMDTMRATLMRMEQLLVLEEDTSIGSVG